MIVREIDKLINNIKILNKTKFGNSANNNIVVDIASGYSALSLYSQLKRSGLKSGIIPVTTCNVEHLEDEEIEYIDLYKVFPVMEITLDGFEFFDQKLCDMVDYATLSKLNVVVLYDIITMNPLLREFISLWFKRYLPKVAVIHVFDSCSYVNPERELYRLDVRVHHVLSKDLSKIPGVSLPLTYLTQKIRNGKYEKLSVKDQTKDSYNDAYSFMSVIGRDFMRKVSVEELMSFRGDGRLPTFFCPNQHLGYFTKRLREIQGYTKITPREGEELIAYNNFKTVSGLDDIYVRKGTTMIFQRLISENIMIVKINDIERTIMFDKNVFRNVLQCDIMGDNRYILESHDPLVAHVFYTYALTSSMFGHVVCDDIVSYVDGVVSSGYIYSLFKSSRKSTTVLIDSSVIDTDFVG